MDNTKFKRQLPAMAIIFNKKNEILLSQRFAKNEKWHKYWQFPGGGIEFGEDPRDAAIRETQEEVGLKIKLLSDLAIVMNHSISKTNEDYICIAYPAIYLSGEIDTSKDDDTIGAKWFKYYEINFKNCLPLTKEFIDEARKFIN